MFQLLPVGVHGLKVIRGKMRVFDGIDATIGLENDFIQLSEEIGKLRSVGEVEEDVKTGLGEGEYSR